jgi:type IV pilus assembly protein PilV
MNTAAGPNARCARNRRIGARGFTMVEVLVSLVVLSIGLLGIGKLVLFSARANDSAYLRSQATALAYEILDNMRANLPTAKIQGYDVAIGTVPGAPQTCLATICSATQVANYDVYTWKQHLTALPGGQGSVVTSVTSPVTATIIVRWDDEAAQSTFSGTPIGVQYESIVLETVLQ